MGRWPESGGFCMDKKPNPFANAIDLFMKADFYNSENSIPFFIGIIGNRYGWVPDESQVHSILKSQDRKISESGQKSVTELEILYNIKKCDINGSMAKYYFRTITNAKPGFFRKSFVPQIYSERV